LVVGLMAAGLLAGCTAAVASPSATALVALSGSPSQPAGTAAIATPSPTSTPSPTPSTTPLATPLPNVGAAPTGPWSGIHWISAGSVFTDSGVNIAPFLTIFGWSRGYVAFGASGDPTHPGAPTASSSADGLHWTASQLLDVGGLEFEVRIAQVVEGPSGLLAVGHYPRGTCGGPTTVDALWTSTDGVSWSRVHLPADFVAAAVYTVDGGSSGYIASGTLKDGVTPAVWLSGDGRSWSQVPLPKPSAGGIVEDGAASFGDGYVLSGAERLDVGCGASVFMPSLWWSTDGRSWTRSQLAGAVPSTNAQVTVSRISDHALMATATEYDDTTGLTSVMVWVTADGRAWKLVKSPSDMLGLGILTNRQRGLVVALSPDAAGPPTIATVGDDLTVTPLNQTGDGPLESATSPGWVWAIGPTGVVILNSDGSVLWLGVPTAA
jgi:hypothetical protein